MIKKNKILDLLLGILITCLGIFISFHPLDTLMFIALYTGVIFLLGGSAYLIEYFKRKNDRYLSFGLINFLVGVILIGNGELVAKSISVILAFWVLFSSVAQITTSMKFKNLNISFWVYPLISGILGIIFSLMILHNPFTGILTIGLIIGIYMILYGIIQISEYFILDDLE